MNLSDFSFLTQFERTIDNLYEASYYNNRDYVLGASECIIVGAPTKMGTGFFDIVPDLRSSLLSSTISKNIDYKHEKSKVDLFDGIEF